MTDLELFIGKVVQTSGTGQVRVIQVRRHGEKHQVFFRMGFHNNNLAILGA
jgi:hypothetical protein